MDDLMSKDGNTQTFLSLLQSGEELDCDLIIGKCEMPASFVWDENSTITDYGIEQFRPIMDAAYSRLPNGNIEIHCNDYRLGERFAQAAAGYIGISEYENIFGDIDLYAKTIRHYNDKITARVLRLLERHGANREYFWLVCAGKDFVCWVESGNVHGYREYSNEAEFVEACKALANDLNAKY